MACQDQAEPHPEAARQFIMAELVTKADIQTITAHFDATLDNLSLRLIVRLGITIAAAITILAAIIRLASFRTGPTILAFGFRRTRHHPVASA
jgi:hypothetical protein